MIFRHRFNHLKVSVGLDTLPKVLALRFPDVPYSIDKTDWVCHVGGSEIWLGGLDDKERTEKILGQEYATLFLNECSEISYQAVLTAHTRLAQKTSLTNRAYYDMNPAGSRHWTSLLFIAKKDPASRHGSPVANPDNYASLRLNPDGNRENLAAEYLEELRNLPDRQRRRFLLGEFSVELDNVLWKPEVFRHVPADPKILARQCNRVVVAVDPSGASGSEDKRSDEIGIIVAGRHRAGYVVLADRTMRGSPQEWARAAVKAYAEFQADAIVAERNFGGAMVADNIRAVAGPGVSIREVTASRSKHVRAEPISSLYAKGLVEHVARVTADGNVIGLEELEAQCCNMTTSGFMGDRSPDRLDAMVWALSDLAFAPPKNRVMVFNGAW